MEKVRNSHGRPGMRLKEREFFSFQVLFNPTLTYREGKNLVIPDHQ
jgi:hypothetical protein